MLKGPSYIQENTHHVTNLHDMLQEITPNTLVVLDFDFNIAYYEGIDLATDPDVHARFGEATQRILDEKKAQGISDYQLTKADYDFIDHEVIGLYSEVVNKIPLDHVVAVDPKFIETIKQKQQEGVHFIILTSRNCDRIEKRTFEHITHLGLDFNQGIFKDKDYRFEIDGKKVLFKEGVMMVSGGHKGKCLTHGLELIKADQPKCFLHDQTKLDVRFSDDGERNVSRVMESLQNYPCKSFSGFINHVKDDLVASIKANRERSHKQEQLHRRPITNEEADHLLALDAIKSKSNPCLQANCPHAGQVVSFQLAAGEKYPHASYNITTNVPHNKVPAYLKALDDAGISCDDHLRQMLLSTQNTYTPAKRARSDSTDSNNSESLSAQNGIDLTTCQPVNVTRPS